METAVELINLLNITDETSRIEVKRGSSIDKSILQSVCAFSNEPNLNGGYILLGIVSDEMSLFPQYNVVGVENPDKLQSDLASQCASIFNMPVRPEITVEQINGKSVLHIFVPELQVSQKPLFFKSEGLPKGAFRRIGPTDQRCTEDDLHLFFNHSETFDNSIVKGSFLEDLDENAINQYRFLRSKVNAYAEELNYSDIDLLIALGCAKREADHTYLTYAGLLVFGSSMAQRRLLPALRVDYIRVPGNEWVADPDDRFSTIDMRGSLILLIQRAYSAIADDLPKGFLLPEGQIQAESTGLPGRVLREALVNAFIHRSFKVNQPIQIIRYGNRIEIKNPGYSLKPEDQLGNPGSNQRNPFIAAIFHETNLAETKGSGIRTMRKLMQQGGMVAPTFESDHQENYFSARLLLHHFLSEVDIKWLNGFAEFSLNDHQKQALVFVKEVGAIDNATYRQLSGADILKSSTDLRVLRDANLLIANGKSRMTYYTPGPGILTMQNKNQSLQDKVQDLQDKSQGLQDSNQITGVQEQRQAESETLLQSLPENIRLQIMQIGRRSGERHEIENLIIDICKVRPFTVKELSGLIGRHIKHLQTSYLKQLIATGKLKYVIPDMPKHPDQAYITQ